MLSKGVKRKYTEVDGDLGESPETTMVSGTSKATMVSGTSKATMVSGTPSSLPAVQSHCLMNISLVKLHRSLRHVEPNLRHLVLVANTLRRLQDNMQTEPVVPGGWRATDDGSRKDIGKASESKKLALESQGEDPLLSTMDTTLYSSISTILEDLNTFEGLSSSPLPQLEDEQDPPVSPSREDSGKLPPPPGLVSSSTYLLGDSLEDIFEDIDTSMYDSDPWSSSNLLNFKAFSNTNERDEEASWDGQDSMLELSELDYLMDVLVGAQNR